MLIFALFGAERIGAIHTVLATAAVRAVKLLQLSIEHEADAAWKSLCTGQTMRIAYGCRNLSAKR